MNRRVIAIAAGFILLVLAGGCVTPTPSPNPPLNSAISAHGNTDWHIDTAEEFLFGTDMGGTTTAANHCPSTWTRRHMHVGLSNTENYYYDDDIITSGLDTDATNGIETAMLFFYAGHGSPTSWSTLGGHGHQDDMRLANFSNGGLLRYYWQCSCEVFAHGPHDCPGSTHAYSCPGDFDGSADSWAMRNVYERWGPVLTADLRMACGSSTSAYCHEFNVNAIWDNYNNQGKDVADSFILGLNDYASWVTPLCITMGGSDVTNTPLYDTTFTNLANSSGTSYYHIQYMLEFDRWRRLYLRVEIPELLPVIELLPDPLPDPYREMKFEPMEDFMYSEDEIPGRGPVIRINNLSGAIYLLGEVKPVVDGPILEQQEYIELAEQFIREQGWAERDVGLTYGQMMMLESVPIEGDRSQARIAQKDVIVTFRRQIDMQGTPVYVLGGGGIMTVQFNNDGTILNATKVWRELGEPVEWLPVKPFDQAFDEALRQLDDPEQYELDQWLWGYMAEPGNVEQKEMRIAFQFWFVPEDPELTIEFPPRLIEIPGMIEG
jgi:hypothetical protein